MREWKFFGSDVCLFLHLLTRTCQLDGLKKRADRMRGKLRLDVSAIFLIDKDRRQRTSAVLTNTAGRARSLARNICQSFVSRVREGEEDRVASEAISGLR